ncbi:MAG TPA: zf-HC2 domain-containing protein [Pseudonocardiaceae bacterium]|nr:zf-HC2 domain-containing protein [Pseudonocardiaceae bacterium]
MTGPAGVTADDHLACNEFVELVTAFLERALDPETERRVVEHLALCEGCQRYLEQCRQTIARLGELPADTLPAPARAALLEAFRSGR